MFPPTLAWLIDEAAKLDGAERFLAGLGARLLADGLPLAGGALTMDVADPLIARRAWLWRAGESEVFEAPAFAGLGAAHDDQAARDWLISLAPGPALEHGVGEGARAPRLAWIGARPLGEDEAAQLRAAARASFAPLAALSARDTLRVTLEAYLGRRSAAQALAAPLRRVVGEKIEAALLFADLRGFTALSEREPAEAVIVALDGWFDRIAGAVHAFGGEVLKFLGDGLLAIFPVAQGGPGASVTAGLRAVAAARAGMARLNAEREGQGLAPLEFGAALHLGEILWGNIGAANRLDFTAIGPAVNIASRIEGLCRPLGRPTLISAEAAAKSEAPLVSLGAHALRGLDAPCEIFALAEDG